MRDSVGVDWARNGRYKKEEKGKMRSSKPQKPRVWLPQPIFPNNTEGVRTRAIAAEVAKYERKRQNDETIPEVFPHFGGEEENLIANIET